MAGKTPRFLFVFLYFLSVSVFAQRPLYIINIKDHLFYPAEITIPENTQVILVINNHDNSSEQFDSFDLNREKVIFAGKKSLIYIGPLAAGRYKFYGEFHPDTAQGTVIVSPNVKPSKESMHVN